MKKLYSLLLLLLVLACAKESDEVSNPKRVVALAPSVTEMVAYVGKADRLVGVSRFSDYPPQVTNLPVVGNIYEADLEAIAELEPDLVIASYSGNSDEDIFRLEQLGFETLTLYESSVSDIIDNVYLLGELFEIDVTRKAELLSEKLRRVDEISVSNSGKAAMAWIQYDPIYSAGPRSFVGDMIEQVGYSNVVGAGVAYPVIDEEELMRLNPEIIFMIAYLSNRETEIQSMLAELGMESEFIYVESDQISRPGPRIFDLMLELAE